MAVVINTNVDSLKVQANLTNSTNRLSKAMERMSTGLKVLNAKDDAAGTVIASRMKVQMDGNKIAQQNVQNGSALLATAEGHLSVVESNLSRIRDLTLQARNGTYSQEEKEAMNDEVYQRILEINRISDSSKYSDLKLFGDTDVEPAEDEDDEPTTKLARLAKDGAVFQVGANAEKEDRIEANKDLFQSVKFADLVATSETGNKAGTDGGLTVTGGSVQHPNDFDAFKAQAGEDATTLDKAFNIAKLSVGNLDKAIRALDKGLDNISHRRSILGSAQNRLESALDTLTTQYENLSSAKSVILDADIAQEASNFTQQNILQQVSTSLLAQANQAPAIALSLI